MLHWTPREKKISILLALSLVFLISMSYVLWGTNQPDHDPMPFEELPYEELTPKEGEITRPAAESDTIWVDVKGAVHKPGVYELAGNSRVYQALEAGGGMLAEAEARAVNLAKPLEDGEMLFVPLKGEEPVDLSLIHI